MSIPTRCERCGHRGVSRMISISDSRDVTIRGGYEPCARCGGPALYQSGNYDFVGDVVAAFRAPGVTREAVTRLGDIAKGVQTGVISADEAAVQISELAAPLATVWDWSNKNAGALSLLVAIIALFLTIYYEAESDAADAEERALARQQVEATQSLHEVQEKILIELQRTGVVPPAPKTQPTPKPPKPPAIRAQKPMKAVAPNRRERRKAAALARRQKL